MSFYHDHIVYIQDSNWIWYWLECDLSPLAFVSPGDRHIRSILNLIAEFSKAMNLDHRVTVLTSVVFMLQKRFRIAIMEYNY